MINVQSNSKIVSLVPSHTSNRSFYGKALVVINKDQGLETDTLYSYGTKVAEHVGGNYNVNVLFDKWDYSSTTLKHVKEFIYQFGGFLISKKLTKGGIKKMLESNSSNIISANSSYATNLIK